MSRSATKGVENYGSTASPANMKKKCQKKPTTTNERTSGREMEEAKFVQNYLAYFSHNTMERYEMI
jgi:hypothetical protein